MAGKGVIPGDYRDMQMVDIAPTVAAILGTSIPATNEGHPLIAMYDFSLDQVKAINNELSIQQSQLARLYQEAIGEQVNVAQSQDIVTATQAAMDKATELLMNIQRIPRGIVTFVAIFFLLTVSAWHARPYYDWMLIGVVCYILVFNIKYLLIDHKTYSLSSVTDVTSLIASTALTTLLALFVAWLVVILGTKIYLLKPRKVADLTMKFILVTLSFVALPVLVHYFINGAIVTWALPNFLISFLGFIFLIQALMVAAIGLFLTGISPLLGYFAHGK